MTKSGCRVAVLLCTFNGGRFLDSQLKSIAAQRDCNADLYVSDDGSTDETLEILQEAHSEQWPEYTLLKSGPGNGHCANFLSLLCCPQIHGDYFAYCDQDDVWDQGKLSRALGKLLDCDDSKPVLYCARTRSITESNQVTGMSPLFARPPSFLNALIHNIGAGNTMVMNNAARQLLIQAGVVDVVSHDWWTYLLVSGAGGVVIYDPEPCLGYRQHPGNQIGANSGPLRRLGRYLKAFGGANREWNTRNLTALHANSRLLTEDNLEALEAFSDFRDRPLLDRLRGLKRVGLYAQTFSGNLGLFFATLLKKI